jgi:iron complex transport system ATP-binding protein
MRGNMENYYFHTQQLCVGYEGVLLIKNIEIELQRGEILSVIGPNGAGKSTILKTIAGQLALLGGTVYLEKDILNKMSEKERSKKVSLVLTERIRPELMTCEDVVFTGRYPYTGRLGILSAHDRNKVREVMELIHITDMKDKEFVTLSDGQKQRVMLARALCQEPDILILDEPTSYLDIKYKLEFLSVLQKITRKKQVTVIMSLHELELAQRVSDKILCVKGEEIDDFGVPEEIFRPGYLSKLYDIEEGALDELSGIPELPMCTGEPKVFVIAGGGSGRAVFRDLQRRGIPFVTGIIQENDLDYPVAKALAVNLISEKAFSDISDERFEEALKEIDKCSKVICSLQDFGTQNKKNREIKEYAKNKGKLIVKSLGRSGELCCEKME